MTTPSTFGTDILRGTILSHLKTDNIFFDILLGGLVMTLMNKFMESVFKINPIQYVKTIKHSFRCGKKNEIVLVRKEYISSNFWDTKETYPKSIIAIYNYMNKKNIVKTGSVKHVETKNKQLLDVAFMVESSTPIEVDDGIFFVMNWGEDGKLVIDNNKGERTVEHKYSLYSYKKSIKDLVTFLNRCISELEEDTIVQLNNKPCYFMYDKKEDGMLRFDEYPLENDRNFDNIFFDQKEDVKDRLDFFINNRQWYQKKGIPYTLGLMFSGKPGCGKTSTIKAIAKYTKRHIIDIPLTKIDNCRDLMNIFYGEEINEKKIPMNKRIYLFEDIDSILDVLKEREQKDKDKELKGSSPLEEQNAFLLKTLVDTNKTATKVLDKIGSNDKLNLGFFLNLIDGVLETPGRILILSTNYPDKLDRALVRPGRIDMKVHMEKCSHQMIRDIIKHYYERDDYVEESIVDSLYMKDITPAELYQICFKYQIYEDFKNALKENTEEVFNMYIDREEEAVLKKLSKDTVIKSSSTGNFRKKATKVDLGDEDDDMYEREDERENENYRGDNSDEE
jgi:ATP-dependent 26S proteasome regulatory subunit